MFRVFISSVQKELAAERRAVKDFIRQNPLLSRFFGVVFLFEDIPACDRQPGSFLCHTKKGSIMAQTAHREAEFEMAHKRLKWLIVSETS